MYDSNEEYPRPQSDPESDGLPEPADDDSNAYDEVTTSRAARAADGRDPAALPADREDGPDGLEEYGTGGPGGLRGEPIWRRLRRERPDVSPDSIPMDPDARLNEEADPDALDQVADDSLEVADDAVLPEGTHSVVSEFDEAVTGVPLSDRIGRLVQPDDGGFEDVDADEFARDAGSAGGGPSAEEEAVHEIRPDNQPGEDLPDDDARNDAVPLSRRRRQSPGHQGQGEVAPSNSSKISHVRVDSTPAMPCTSFEDEVA